MAGGLVAGIVGPQTAKWSLHWLDPMVFAGVYVMTMIFAAGGYHSYPRHSHPQA